jgi:MFS family permease
MEHFSGSGPSAKQEWRRYWPIVLGSAMGYSCIGLQTFCFGPFVGAIEQEFGWSRAQTMSGFTVMSGAAVLFNLLGGIAVDRFGARPVALFGQLLLCSSFALLSLADGSIVNWIALWALVAVAVGMMQGPVWTRSVAALFDKGRGLAIAAVLSGSSLTAALAPLIATALIDAFDWRSALIGTAAIWLGLTLPFSFMLFARTTGSSRSGNSPMAAEPGSSLPGMTVREAMRQPAYWLIVGGMFSFILYTMALAPNLVPLLISKKLSLGAAAQIAALVGVVGLVARLSVGHLLDIFPTHIVASLIFLFPLLGLALMMQPDPGILALVIATAIFGATVGAENDVIIYLVSKFFGMRSFGALLGGINSIAAIAATIGPIGAGWIYDRTGTYDLMLLVVGCIMGLGALGMFALGRLQPIATLPSA